MSPAQYQSILDNANHPVFQEALANLWQYPWEMFFMAPADLTRTFGNAAYLGFLVPLCLPLLLLAGRPTAAVRRLLFAGLAVYLLWIFGFKQVRYFLPGAAVLLILSAHGAREAWHRLPAAARGVLGAAIAACLLFNAGLGTRMVDSWLAVAGFDRFRESDDAFLMRHAALRGATILDSYPIYHYVNDKAPPDARVLVIGDAQHLYLQRRHLYSYLSGSTPWDVLREAAGRPGEIAARLKGEGVTHIVYAPAELRRLQEHGAVGWPREDNRSIEEFLAGPEVRPVTRTPAGVSPVLLFELR